MPPGRATHGLHVVGSSRTRGVWMLAHDVPETLVGEQGFHGDDPFAVVSKFAPEGASPLSHPSCDTA